MDVWEDMDCPVLISSLCVNNSLCLSSQAMSSYRDVAYMGDFAEEDLLTLGLIRIWAPRWSSNGTRGMMHTHGNLGARLKISRRTQLVGDGCGILQR